jgi:hypothetical protein
MTSVTYLMTTKNRYFIKCYQILVDKSNKHLPDFCNIANYYLSLIASHRDLIAKLYLRKHSDPNEKLMYVQLVKIFIFHSVTDVHH